jgi:hypothetical protein
MILVLQSAIPFNLDYAITYKSDMMQSKFLILAKQTGCFAPGCKFNVESTDVLLPFRPVAENSSHPLRGWWLTPIRIFLNILISYDFDRDFRNMLKILSCLIEFYILEGIKINT